MVSLVPAVYVSCSAQCITCSLPSQFNTDIILSSLTMWVEQEGLSSPKSHTYCGAALYPAEGFAVTTGSGTEQTFGFRSPIPCHFLSSLSPLNVSHAFTLNLPAKSGQGTGNQHSCCQAAIQAPKSFPEALCQPPTLLFPHVSFASIPVTAHLR